MLKKISFHKDDDTLIKNLRKGDPFAFEEIL